MPPHYNTFVDNINIKIGSSDINVVSSVTNLGVRLDRNLKMTAQTSHLMSSCVYQLKLVNSIRASLDVQVAERVVNAIFTSRLDYCNSLLAGLTVQDCTRLQRLQNAAARCVLMRPRDFSATDMFCELRKRVHYKLLLLTYKTLNGSAPECLVNQLQDYCPTRVLRSADQNLLSVKKTHIKIGDSYFTVAGSVLWNALPCKIKKARPIDCFKSMIKTISLGYKLCHNELLFCTLYYIHISALNMLHSWILRYINIYILLLFSSNPHVGEVERIFVKHRTL